MKETLRASKLFALNTQELTNHGYNYEEESVESSSGAKKGEEARKGEEGRKVEAKNIIVKKVSKVDSGQKKPATAQKGTRNTEKGDLGEKINKKLESLNIKTAGKKV